METGKTGAVIGSFITRLVVGAIVWAIGAAILVGIAFLSAAPYGGGTAVPLYMVVPWTAVVIFFVLQPLGRLQLFSGLITKLALFTITCGLALGSMYWYLGSSERERTRATNNFNKEFEPHANYFKTVCEKAGAKVFREVRNVEGILVYGLREKTSQVELAQKGFVGDVYSQIDTGYNPETVFVHEFLTKKEWEARWHTPNYDEVTRYPLIEMPAKVDGVSGFYQYTDASVRSEFRTRREFSERAKSAYAIRIEDISTPADREHWIAGTKWTIVDVKTDEVLGEFVAYAMDFLQGQTVFSGGFGNAGEPAAPWLRAGHVQYRMPGLSNACPKKDVSQNPSNSRNFVRSVLFPIRQDVNVIPVKP
jgi:hypothetical protein